MSGDKTQPLDLDAIDDLCERRKNGFASIEHESALMDAVPGLLAALRSPRPSHETVLDALADALEWGRKFGADYGEAMTPSEAWRLWAGKDKWTKALAAPSLVSPPPDSVVCNWREDDPGFYGSAWKTDCGRMWEFTNDGPKENQMDFCMGCGKPVAVVETKPDEDETDEDEEEGEAAGRGGMGKEGEDAG